MLNGLKLYGRVYATKDTNLKFLRSLSKDWKSMTVSLRNSHEFKDYNLENLYGVLKTHELKIQQDEEIEKIVALVAKNKGDKKVVSSEGEVINGAPNRSVCEGKAKANKGKGKAEVEDDSINQDDLDDIDEYIAFLSIRFSKLKFKRNPSMSKSILSYRKDG